MSVKLAINGYGRIGRCVLRAFYESTDYPDLRIVAINDIADSGTVAHLTRYDSTHGRFPGSVKVTKTGMSLGNGAIKVIAERDPAKLPWGKMDIDVVLECTGIFTKREAAAKHIEAGAKRVLISAPASGEDLTVVFGVNDDKLRKKHQVVSNASCTTDATGAVNAAQGQLRDDLQSSTADANAAIQAGVTDAQGNLVALGEIGHFQETIQDKTIYHKNLDRVVYVFAETAGRAPAEAILDIQADRILTPDYGGRDLRRMQVGPEEGYNKYDPAYRVWDFGETPVESRTYLANGAGIPWYLEEEFDVNIPDDAAEKIQTVGQAIEYIEKAQSS